MATRPHPRYISILSNSSSASCRRMAASHLRAATPVTRSTPATPATPPSHTSAGHRAFHQSSQQASDAFKHALESNKKWAAATAQADPAFLPTLAKGQAPAILWLGCADSRVPETTILGLKPGDVFTHRNIANVLHPSDISMLSIVQYAVAHVKVQHVVVCGHTSCGGVVASLGNAELGVLDVWLQSLRALREKYSDELDKLDGPAKSDFLARANIRHGIDVLRRIPAVIDAQRDRGLQLHGLLYNLETGILEEVEAKESEEECKKRIAAFDLNQAGH